MQQDSFVKRLRQTPVGHTLTLNNSDWRVESKGVSSDGLNASIVLVQNTVMCNKITHQARRIFTFTRILATKKMRLSHELKESYTPLGKVMNSLYLCSLLGFGSLLYALGKTGD